MSCDKRFLVLDRTNNAIRPSRVGYPARKPVIQSKNSPSFLKSEDAKAFAAWLATRNQGQAFYVLEVQSSAMYVAPTTASLKVAAATGHPLLGTTAAPMATEDLPEVDTADDNGSDDLDDDEITEEGGEVK